MPFKYTYIFPIMIGIWFPITFAITYGIAVWRKDVPPDFPYISDTGTWSPESCFFGFMLNTGALMQGLIVYLRYRQVQDLLEKHSFEPFIKKYNLISLIMGIIGALGVCIVGNFQETNMLIVHIIGASIAFLLGSIYQCMQTHVSYGLYPMFGNKKINVIRLICSIISCITLTITGIFGVLSLLEFDGEDITKWTSKQGGYVYHLISAAAEWILVTATITFLTLYTGEFKKIVISPPIITTSAN